MKPATINQLKKELQQRHPGELIELCLRLAKYKVDSKELLNYLLFEADNEDAYVAKVEEHVHELFTDIPRNQNVYYVRKSVRKILRLLNKHIRFSGNKETEATLRLYFCTCMKEYINMRQSTTLSNIFDQQVKQINTAIGKLHEDLQYDLQKELDELLG